MSFTHYATAQPAAPLPSGFWVLREVPEMLQFSLLISGLRVYVGTGGAWDRDTICGKDTF